MKDGATPLFMAAEHGHLAKATTTTIGRDTPLHIAIWNGHIDVAICLMEGLADLNARTRDPMDLARNEEMRQAIINEEERRRNHGYRRAVIPNPTPAEVESHKRDRLQAGIMDEDEDQDQAGGSGSASVSANATSDVMAAAEEDDDDSGSDEPHEEAYLKSLKRQRTK